MQHVFLQSREWYTNLIYISWLHVGTLKEKYNCLTYTHREMHKIKIKIKTCLGTWSFTCWCSDCQQPVFMPYYLTTICSLSLQKSIFYIFE